MRGLVDALLFEVVEFLQQSRGKGRALTRRAGLAPCRRPPDGASGSTTGIVSEVLQPARCAPRTIRAGREARPASPCCRWLSPFCVSWCRLLFFCRGGMLFPVPRTSAQRQDAIGDANENLGREFQAIPAVGSSSASHAGHVSSASAFNSVLTSRVSSQSPISSQRLFVVCRRLSETSTSDAAGRCATGSGAAATRSLPFCSGKLSERMRQSAGNRLRCSSAGGASSRRINSTVSSASHSRAGRPRSPHSSSRKPNGLSESSGSRSSSLLFSRQTSASSPGRRNSRPLQRCTPLLATGFADEPRRAFAEAAIAAQGQPGKRARVALAKVSCDTAEISHLFMPCNGRFGWLLFMRPAEGGVVEVVAVWMQVELPLPNSLTGHTALILSVLTSTGNVSSDLGLVGRLKGDSAVGKIHAAQELHSGRAPPSSVATTVLRRDCCRRWSEADRGKCGARRNESAPSPVRDPLRCGEPPPP